jgi:hypothetical protein
MGSKLQRKRRNKRRGQRARTFLDQQKRGKHCARCGIEDWRVLDFVSYDSTKQGWFGRARSVGYGIQGIQHELDNCAVVCENCQRIASSSGLPKEGSKGLVNLQKAGKRCVRCGIDDPSVLDFHHRDPAEKKFSLGRIQNSVFDLEIVQKEIAKCDLLCANCHRILHMEEENHGI